MKKLQVLTESGWKYVFCYNRQTGIVTTNTKSKALPTSSLFASDDLTWFSTNYGNNTFRLAKSLDC